ncbi:unnamed protein product [Sphenostylis stenocarpa]|uniref:Uncharacterized protein n=1 Tax=Sphenostylis stenocarpa TaxID=92480 RepID=A0AA86VQX5_9FABA|nr:unnamed protein product [Sphenostylis stenocarpa]
MHTEKAIKKAIKEKRYEGEPSKRAFINLEHEDAFWQFPHSIESGKVCGKVRNEALFIGNWTRKKWTTVHGKKLPWTAVHGQKFPWTAIQAKWTAVHSLKVCMDGRLTVLDDHLLSPADFPIFIASKTPSYLKWNLEKVPRDLIKS